MKKIEISLSEEQYKTLTEQMKAGAQVNLEEETFSGFSLTLSVVEGNISWLEFEMNKKVDLGEVSWRID